MGFVFKLEDYGAYRQRVGGATYVDITRRTDPAKVDRVWENLAAVVEAYGAPWAAQLWTKDLAGALDRGHSLLHEMRGAGTALACQLTVTGLFGTAWEPANTASPFAGAEAFAALAGGPEHVKWRYDPVVPTVHREARFARLAGQAEALGIRRCVINFIAPPGRYKRVDRRLAQALPGWADGMPGYDDDWKLETAAALLDIARDHGLTLAVCAESAHLSEKLPGLGRAACGDRDWFVALSGRDPGIPEGRGSRPGCGCAPYFDVGLYGQWRRCHQCLYCYAG